MTTSDGTENPSFKDFPDPNPYFPPPARQRAGLPWSISLPMFVAGGPGVVLSLKYVGELGDGLAIGLMFASFIAFLFGMGSFFQSFVHMPWRHGRIVPALVESRAGPPEQSDGAGCAMILMPHVLGLLVELLKLANRERNPNALLLTWFDRGRVRSGSVMAGKHWQKWEAGDAVWICILPPFKKAVVETVCPSSFEVPSVPPEVASRLRADVVRYESLTRDERKALRRNNREAADRARREESERKQAAQANARALKRTTQYEKRPD